MTTPALEKIASDPAFRELAARARRRRFSRNEIIVHEGEPARTLYYLLSGSVSVRRTDERGEEVLLAYRFAGDFFGEMCLFPGVNLRSAMVQARDECVALDIAYPDFLELTRKHTGLWLELAGQLAERLRATNQRLALMPVLHAAERIWSVVAEIASHGTPQPGTGEIAVRVTRQEIGKLAGCSRELAGMVLKDLERAGRVKLRGQTVLVAASALAGPPLSARAGI